MVCRPIQFSFFLFFYIQMHLNLNAFPTVMAKEVAGHAALIEKLRISPYRVGLQWVAESMLMGR